jgi:hypothetical protein
MSFRDGPKDQTSDVQLHIGESRDSGFDAEPVIGPAKGRTRWHRPGMTVVQTDIAPKYLLCYRVEMFQDRQTIASRVVLDDRSRLPWRFFGRLTTAALAA